MHCIPLRFAAAFILAAFVFTLPLAADQITLVNGDRITGKVVKKDGKTLTVKSEIFGSVNVPWDHVQDVKTEAPVTVVLPGGETVNAGLESHDGKLNIRTPEAAREVPLPEVVTIRDADEQRTYQRLLRPDLTDLWAGTMNFGIAGTQGSAETRTLTAALAAARTTSKDKTSVYFNAIRANALVDKVSASTARAIRAGWAHNHNITPRFFANTFNDYEYDRFQNLDLRFVLGTGLGYQAWKSDRGQLDLVGGGAYNREGFSPPAPESPFVRHSGEAYFGDDFKFTVRSGTSLYEQVRFFPNLTRTGDYRINVDIGADTKLNKWLSWNIAVSNRLVSNPVPGKQKNDFLYTTGLGITFKR